MPTCVEPAMLHLAYKSEFLEPLNWGYMYNVAHRCRILVVLEVIGLDTLSLCNSDKHGLGQCKYLCMDGGYQT